VGLEGSGSAPRPEPKRSRVKSTGQISPHVKRFVYQHRCGVWRHEEPIWIREEKKWKIERPARSPKSVKRKIRYSDEWFDDDKHFWGSFPEAVAAFEKNTEYLDGIVLLIEPYRPLNEAETFHPDPGEIPVHRKSFPVYIDFDDCLDPVTGEVKEPWVRQQIETLNSFTEISPSGKGLHVFGWGKKRHDSYTVFPKEYTGGLQVEVYGGGVGGRHPITFTGHPLEGFDLPIRNIQSWIDEIVPLKPVHRQDEAVPPEPLGLSGQKVLDVMMTSQKDGGLLQRFMAGDESLWRGENARYSSRHHADQGFFCKLAFYTRADKEMIRRIAFSSIMRRKKWDQAKYLEETIKKGIRYCKGEFYDPHYGSRDAEQGSGEADEDRVVPRKPVDLSDNELVAKLTEIRGEEFERLWRGDLWAGEKLEPEQLRLCSRLSYITGNDEARVDRLFRRSGLYRPNWEYEAYRARTLRLALSDQIYELGWAPADPERDRVLDTLDELRRNLAWGGPGGMNACYIYGALIGKARIGGWTKTWMSSDDIDIVAPSEIFGGFEPDIMVEASDRGLMLGSGVYRKGGVGVGKKLLENEGLIITLRKGKNGRPSLYLLRTLANIPDKVIPYPPGFIGNETYCTNFASEVLKREDHGGSGLAHAFAKVDYRNTMKRVPKKPFRSQLNSMACHDANIKALVQNTRLDDFHPDIGKSGLLKTRGGEWQEYFKPHPPLALSPPVTEPIFYFNFYEPDQESVQPLCGHIRRKLFLTIGLSPKQKFVVEQVDHGRTTLVELEKFFDISRRDNFKSRIIEPLIQKGLLTPHQCENLGEHYDKPDDFEQALTREFAASCSQARREEIAETIEAERQAYKRKLKKWDDDSERWKELQEFLLGFSGRKANRTDP